MATYTKIAKAEIPSGGASTLTFTSIPSTYTDLILFSSLRVAGAPAAWGIARVLLKVGSITTGYTNRLVYSGGTGTVSSDGNSDYITYFYANASDSTSYTFSNNAIYIPNYAGSTTKSFIIDSTIEYASTGGGILSASSGNLSNTAPITSLTITPADAINLVEFSSATLYGISK